MLLDATRLHYDQAALLVQGALGGAWVSLTPSAALFVAQSKHKARYGILSRYIGTIHAYFTSNFAFWPFIGHNFRRKYAWNALRKARNGFI